MLLISLVVVVVIVVVVVVVVVAVAAEVAGGAFFVHDGPDRLLKGQPVNRPRSEIHTYTIYYTTVSHLPKHTVT